MPDRQKWDRKYRETHPERVRESASKHYYANLEKQRERSRKKYYIAKSRDPEGYRLRQLKQSRSKRGRFSAYRKASLKRGIVFELSFDEFASMWCKPCTYCGDAIEGIGVDRIDNTKGYTVDNTAPCCGRCNHMKNKLTVPQFIERCRKIVEWNGKDGELQRRTKDA